MDKFTISLLVFQALFIIKTEEFEIKRKQNNEIEREYYNFRFLQNSDMDPSAATRIFGGQEINEFSNRYVYEVKDPKEISKDQNKIPELIDDHLEDIVIIKSKVKSMDLGPFTLVRKLDEIKYMILWLNVYCGMHPDCDKSKLNYELREMLTTVALPRSDSNISRKISN